MGDHGIGFHGKYWLPRGHMHHPRSGYMQLMILFMRGRGVTSFNTAGGKFKDIFALGSLETLPMILIF